MTGRYLRWILLLLTVYVVVAVTTAQDIPGVGYTALQDLGARLGKSLTLDDLQNWYWSEEGYLTTGLGCTTFPNPEPTPTVGYEFMFKVDNQEYFYYQPRGGELYWCSPQGPQALLPIGGGSVPSNPDVNAGNPVDAPPVPTVNPFINCGVYPRLNTTDHNAGIVSPERSDGLNIREFPSPDAPLRGSIPPNAFFAVLEGPNCDTQYTYWRISYNGLEGWAAEGAEGKYYMDIAPMQGGGNIDVGCVQPTRLSRGVRAKVLPEAAPLNMRRFPFPEAEKVGEVPADGVLNVLAGPNCHPEYNYWQVEYQGVIAWMAEATSEEYYLEALGMPLKEYGIELFLPFTIAQRGAVESVADVTLATKPDANYWSVLPQHIAISLFDEQKATIGTLKIFRTSDYEAFYPTSIPALREVLAQRNSTMLADFNATNLYVTNAVHLFRTRESFIDLPNGGGTIWRMVAGYSQSPALTVNPLSYIAVGLSADGNYFYQVVINTRLVGEETTNTAATWQDVASFVQTSAVPSLTNAQPSEFTPLLEDLDTLVLDLKLSDSLLPPRTFAQFCGTLRTRLAVGTNGRVTPGEPNNLRTQPNRDSEKVGEIPGGETFRILEGPVCDDTNGAWWRVRYGELEAWTIEGRKDTYWLEPANGVMALLPFTAVVLPPRDTLATLTGQAPLATVAPVVATCPDFLPSRLVVGQRGRVLPGDANNVRSTPSGAGEKVGEIPPGSEFDVLEGPICGDSGAWWRVSYNGLVGWTIEGRAGSYWLEPLAVSVPAALPTVTPASSSAVSVCPGFMPSRLVIGHLGQVLPGEANNLRSEPNPNGVKVGEIPGDGYFSVLEGPVCGNDGAWWRVNYNGTEGWTLEGQGNTYWVTYGGVGH